MLEVIYNADNQIEMAETAQNMKLSANKNRPGKYSRSGVKVELALP